MNDKNLINQYLFLVFFALTLYLLMDKFSSTEEPSIKQDKTSTSTSQTPQPSQPLQKNTPLNETNESQIVEAFQTKITTDLVRMKKIFAETEPSFLDKNVLTWDEFTDNISIDVKKTNSLVSPYQGIAIIRTYVASSNKSKRLPREHYFYYNWQKNSWVVSHYEIYVPQLNKFITDDKEATRLAELMAP